MSIPALRELRRIFPAAHIALHTRSWAEGIFRDVDFVDEIIPFEPENNSLQTVRKQARKWRERKFDVAILFTNSFQTALLSYLGRATKRFGYRNEGRSFLLTDPLDKPVWRNEKHEVYYYLNLISAIEEHHFATRTSLDAEPDISLNVANDRRADAKEFLAQNGIDLSKKVIALGVGSANSRAKRWMPEGYASLNDLLRNEIGAEVVLIGSTDELDISEQVADLSQNKPIILTGKTTLAEAVAVLSEVDLHVSNDTGLAHIAAAVGTQTLTIFGPTNPRTTAPWNSEIIVRSDVECAPCMLRDCPIDHPCMMLITPEFVFERAAALLN